MTPCAAQIFQPIVAGEITELVRGNENALLERFMPLVRRQSVALDLEAVTRIDAAGLAALITVYCTARESGHDFTILNPSSHVAEILAVVGLDKILVAQHGGSFSNPASRQKSPPERADSRTGIRLNESCLECGTMLDFGTSLSRLHIRCDPNTGNPILKAIFLLRHQSAGSPIFG